MPRPFAALRSVLYVPASNPRAMAKAATLPCDAVILDLEDAVAPEGKVAARADLRAALEAGLFAEKAVVIRVNGLPEREDEPDLLAEDLAALAPFSPHAFLLPKIAAGGDVARVERALNQYGVRPEVGLWLMIERPAAILALREIAAQAGEPGTRLSCFVMGTNDLAKEMRLPGASNRLALLHALSATIVAARAYGLDVLDGVFGDIRDPAGFEAECLHGRSLGFDGKTLIHPGQIETANRVFSPSSEEIRAAQAIIAAFEAPENAGKGVIVVEGRMTERLHYDIARRIAGIG